MFIYLEAPVFGSSSALHNSTQRKTGVLARRKASAPAHEELQRSICISKLHLDLCGCL